LLYLAVNCGISH